MMRRDILQTGAVVFIAALSVAGCTSTPPPPEPVLEVVGKTCHDTASLATPVPLTPAKGKLHTHDFTHKFDEASPCLTVEETAVNYAVFELPVGENNLALTVGGSKQVLRTLATDISVLDADGNETRQFPPDKFMDIGSIYGVQLRPRAGERYLLVKTQPLLIGETVNSHETQMITSTNYYSTGYTSASYNTYSGADVSRSRTFSHEGVVHVRVQALNGKIGFPEE